MKQEHIDKIKTWVNEDGLIYVINQIEGGKDIIRKVYTDNPESYLDYLIDNLIPMDSSGYIKKAWTYYLKKNIFLVYEDNLDIVTVDDFIWNYFYRGVMQFDNTKIESIFTKWFYKHIPELSEKKPISYSDIDDIRRKWSVIDEKESLDNDHYIRLSRSVADYYNIINVCYK